MGYGGGGARRRQCGLHERQSGFQAPLRFAALGVALAGAGVALAGAGMVVSPPEGGMWKGSPRSASRQWSGLRPARWQATSARLAGDVARSRRRLPSRTHGSRSPHSPATARARQEANGERHAPRSHSPRRQTWHDRSPRPAAPCERGRCGWPRRRRTTTCPRPRAPVEVARNGRVG